MDRDFIFGVLAVQVGFATPGQVMSAAAGFLADKSRSIAERMQAEGVLDAQKLELLERMVAEAVEVHGGSVEQTMQTLGGEQVLFKSFGGSLAVDEGGQLSVVPEAGRSGDSVEDTSAVTPEVAGRYAVGPDAEIGRGGIGRILVAFDGHLGREIAVKELLAESGGSRQSTPQGKALSRTAALAARFLREARVTGQLEHPNIVPVHEVGQRADGSYYYTMKLVRGRTLAEALADCAGLGERLELLHHYVDLCNAVAYAHSRGVIHRDIKTENVMLGEFGETVLLDWGLAKVEGKKDIRGSAIERELAVLQDEGAGKTVDGSAIGTPAYMSPEQAEGAIDDIDERSDVWSLGAVLYEVLTGRPPFQGATPFEIIGKVIKDDVVPALEIDEAIPGELSAVAQRALRRDRAGRYQQARRLAAEIEAYMSGGRIRAYEYSSWELLRGFVAKNRAASVLGAMLLLLAVVGAVGLFRAYRQADSALQEATEQRAAAEAERVRAHERELDAHYNLAIALDSRAVQLMRDKRSHSARIFAAASLVHNPANPRSPYFEPGAETRFAGAAQLFTSASSVVYQASTTRYASLQRSLTAPADFRQLDVAPGGKHLSAVSLEHRAYVWQLSSGKLLHQLDDVRHAAFAPDGATLATVSESGTIVLVDVASGEPTRSLAPPREAFEKVAYAPDGRTLITADRDGSTLSLWDPTTLEARQHVELARASPTRRVVASPGSDLVAVGYQDGSVRLLDAADGSTRASLQIEPRLYNGVLSKDGSLLVSGDSVWTTRLYDTASGALLQVLRGHEEGVSSVALSPDGTTVVTASGDRTVRIWKVATGMPVAVLDRHVDPVRAVRYSADGATLYTAGSDQAVRVWSVEERVPAPLLSGHEARIWRVAFSPDGKLLASAGADGVRLWDRDTLRQIARLRTDEGHYMSVAFSPDGKLVAAGSAAGGGVHLWKTDSHELVTTIDAHPNKSTSGVTFSPDGKLLASSGTDGKLRLWDVASHELVAALDRHDSHGEASFSPDGRLIASAAKGQKLRVWMVADRKLVAELEGHPDDTFNVEFSPDGKYLASAGRHGHVFVWSAETFEVDRELSGHERWVNTAKYSPDSKLIATGSDEGTVRVWSAETGQTVLLLQVGAEGMCATFSPDGKTLAVIDDRDIRLYPVDLSVREADPQPLLEQAQKEADMRLDGFSLVPLAPAAQLP